MSSRDWMLISPSPCKKRDWQAQGHWRRRTLGALSFVNTPYKDVFIMIIIIIITTLSVGRERAPTSPMSMESALQRGIACWTWWNWGAVVVLNDSWLYAWTPPKAHSVWTVSTPKHCWPSLTQKMHSTRILHQQSWPSQARNNLFSCVTSMPGWVQTTTRGPPASSEISCLLMTQQLQLTPSKNCSHWWNSFLKDFGQTISLQKTK